MPADRLSSTKPSTAAASSAAVDGSGGASLGELQAVSRTTTARQHPGGSDPGPTTRGVAPSAAHRLTALRVEATCPEAHCRQRRQARRPLRSTVRPRLRRVDGAVESALVPRFPRCYLRSQQRVPGHTRNPTPDPRWLDSTRPGGVDMLRHTSESDNAVVEQAKGGRFSGTASARGSRWPSWTGGRWRPRSRCGRLPTRW